MSIKLMGRKSLTTIRLITLGINVMKEELQPKGTIALEKNSKKIFPNTF